MQWMIPDCFWPVKDQGDYVSHEAVCVLNAGASDAETELTLYFEDRPPLTGFHVTVPAERTLHIRLDRLKNDRGEAIPRGTPYAIVVSSGAKLAVQYTRVDTTQPALAIATTIV